jgi:hypothetical protein
MLLIDTQTDTLDDGYRWTQQYSTDGAADYNGINNAWQHTTDGQSRIS